MPTYIDYLTKHFMKLTNLYFRLFTIKKTFRHLIILLLILIVGYADYITPKEMNFRLFYIIPLFLSSWESKNIIPSLFFSFICTLINFYTEFLVGNIYLHGFFLIWEFLIVWGFFILFVVTVAAVKRNDLLLLAKNEELRKANEIKEDLMRIASHDLKNPLQNIMSISGLIKDAGGDVGSETEKYINAIHDSSKRMINLIDEYLVANRAGNSSTVPTLKSVAVNSLLIQLIQQYKINADRKNIKIHFTPTDEKYFIEADEMHAYQVLDNVLSNAIKYSPKGKNIWMTSDCGNVLSSASDGKYIVINIRDEGPGFTEDDKIKMFGKSTRLSALPTDNENSTGNGLYISKKIVESMNGKIWCESSYGSGASFYVAFRKSFS